MAKSTTLIEGGDRVRHSNARSGLSFFVQHGSTRLEACSGMRVIPGFYSHRRGLERFVVDVVVDLDVGVDGFDCSRRLPASPPGLDSELEL